MLFFHLQSLQITSGYLLAYKGLIVTPHAKLDIPRKKLHRGEDTPVAGMRAEKPALCGRFGLSGRRVFRGRTLLRPEEKSPPLTRPPPL